MKSSNVLLTGGTGFLGSHILNQLITETNYKIYCLVRSSDLEAATSKLLQTLHFYFQEDYSPLINQRIMIVVGDFSKEHFNLDESAYKLLETTINTIIHAGATVKHFGLKETFESINVTGTKRLIDFALMHHASFFFTSTIAACDAHNYIPATGDLDQLNPVPFVSNNAYTQSKITAENYFCQAKRQGLNGTIFRIGSLTGRYSDGVFQKNIQENALYSRMKAIMTAHAIPNQILTNQMDFTPVDLCSHAIVTVIQQSSALPNMLYLFNPHTLDFTKFVDLLDCLSIHIDILEQMSLKDYKKFLSSKGVADEAFIGFFLYLKGNVDVDYKALLKEAQAYSIDFLHGLGFDWPIVSENYIEHLISYMKQVHYIA